LTKVVSSTRKLNLITDIKHRLFWKRPQLQKLIPLFHNNLYNYREFGGWERYTKGIGQKLLQKVK
jgi:hypothetical protein